MKAFSFPLLRSHQPRPGTHPLDYHRSSFLFRFPPCVPIQSIFISPLSSLYSCFHFHPISQSSPTLNLQPSLFASSVTSSVSLPPPVCHLSPVPFKLPCFFFPPPTASSPDFSYSFIGMFLSLFLSTHSLPRCQHTPSFSPSLFSAKPSVDQLSPPASCLFQPYISGQLDSSNGSRADTDPSTR